MKLSATLKGLITGLLMIGVSVAIFFAKGNFDNNLQYIAYALYVGGIIWTLVSYHQTLTQQASFKSYFTQGFKCFIVVTLLMVSFTYIFLQLNPAMREEMAANYRAGLMEKQNYMPNQIDEMVLNAKKYFTTMLVSMAIFSYLVIGALVTLITAGFLSQQKRN